MHIVWGRVGPSVRARGKVGRGSLSVIPQSFFSFIIPIFFGFVLPVSLVDLDDDIAKSRVRTWLRNNDCEVFFYLAR